jgi:Fe-S cluster assembly ATP-binding protein
MALLLLNKVAFHAGGKMILDKLDLSIEEREVQAILGSNGTGKSTLAYLIMGCEGYRPSSGDIIFDGRSINSLSIYERAKMVSRWHGRSL